MRPDGLGRTAVGLTFAGIDDIDEVNISVIIGVVVCPVNGVLLVRQDTRLHHNVRRVLIIAFCIIFICSVIGECAAQGDRTINVKLRTVGTLTLVCKILCSRRITAIDRAVQRIAQLVKRSLRMTGLHALVGEISQDNYALRRQIRRSAYIFALTACHGFGAMRLDHFRCRSLAYYLVHTVNLTYLLTRAVDGIVIELVTDGHYLDDGTVGLGYRAPLTVRRNSPQPNRTQYS